MKNRPNILIFMTDQQRGATVLPGHRLKAITPVLDHFREEATTFSQAYCPSPHCCPSRATFLTGLFPSEHGVWNNVNVPNSLGRDWRAHVRPWSCDLREAGYRLFYSGKWHVSNSRGPDQFGWETLKLTGALAAPGSRDEQDREAFRKTLGSLRKAAATPRENGVQARVPGEIVTPGYPPYFQYGVTENPFGDETVVDAACKLFAANGGTNAQAPWCLYVGPLGPHDPYFCPREFLDLYPEGSVDLPESHTDAMRDKPALYRRTRARFDALPVQEQQEALRHYLGVCSYEDALFGKVLDALEASGQADHTLVIYLSDHGDYTGEHGLWCKGLPAFLPAYHIPALVRLPAAQRTPRNVGRIDDSFVSLADFAPTLFEMAGLPVPRELSGRSLMPLLRGERPPDWRTSLVFQSNGNELYAIQRTILTSRWKFTFNGFDEDELYDLWNDPYELRNLASVPDHRELCDGLMREIWKFGLDHEDASVATYIVTGLARVGPIAAFEEHGAQASCAAETPGDGVRPGDS